VPYVFWQRIWMGRQTAAVPPREEQGHYGRLFPDHRHHFVCSNNHHGSDEENEGIACACMGFSILTRLSSVTPRAPPAGYLALYDALLTAASCLFQQASHTPSDSASCLRIERNLHFESIPPPFRLLFSTCGKNATRSSFFEDCTLQCTGAWFLYSLLFFVNPR